MHKSIQQFYPSISPLLQYRGDVTSQRGEDGIIARIMGVLKPNNRYCVEFGAWDGKHHSNCYNLIMNNNWSGVMTEANAEKYGQLVETYRGRSDVKTLNKFVEVEGRNTLDNILKECGAPSDPGVISIDIDGNDYHVWDSLVAFTPELMVIEFNPTIPNDVVFIQEKSFQVSHGNSLLALVQLGEKKGYELVACTELNAFFVKKGNAAVLGVENTSHFYLYTPVQDGRIFQGYDTAIHVVGMDYLMWANRPVSSEDFQVLPKSQRGWGDAQRSVQMSTQMSAEISALALFDQALMRHQTGRFEDAVTLYGLAVDMNPNYVEAFSNRGVCVVRSFETDAGVI